MKAAIEVKSRGEADAIRSGLDDPLTRAVVTVMGVLRPLSARKRQQVIEFVMASDTDDPK